MNPISASVQTPAPRSERDVAPPQPEADSPNPLGADRTHDFGRALREASGATGTARADDRDRGAGPDEPDRKAEPAAASPPPSGAAPVPSDPANAAAALLANLLSTAPPAAGPTAAGDTPLTLDPDGPSRDGASTTAATGPALNPDARAATARAASGGTGLPTAQDRPGSGGKPEVEVLGRAVHFKPVLANAVPAEPAQPDPAAQDTAAQAAAESATQTAQIKRATWPDLMVAAAAKTATKVLVPPQPEPRSADPAPAARGLETASRAVLEDVRAITEVAEAVLDSAGRRGSEGVRAPQPQDAAGTIPALPAGSLTTIAAAINDEITRVAEASPARRAQADPGSRATPDGPLRVLRIQLRPEDLGTVTVELRLANGQLETHLRASRPETAALLHRDAAILTDLLKQAHHQAEVTVGQARPSEGGFSGGSPAQGQPSSDGGARPGQGGERQRQAAQHQAAGRRDGERTDEAVRPRDSGVYL